MKYSVTSLLAILLMGSTVMVSAETVTIRADEWYPINGVPGAEDPGYMIEIAEAVLKPAGHAVDYKIMPWERSLDEVRKGVFDCVVGAYLDDAPDFVFPDQSWGALGSTFYVKKGNNWRYSGIESLANAKVGIIGGYAYSDEFDAYAERNKASSKVQAINANNALEQNIKKLLADRIDTTVESDLVMKAKLKEMNVQDKVESAGLLTVARNIYIACSPAKASSKMYVDLFAKGIEDLRKVST